MIEKILKKSIIFCPVALALACATSDRATDSIADITDITDMDRYVPI